MVVVELPGLNPPLLPATPRLAAAATARAVLTGVQGFVDVACQTSAALLAVPQQAVAWLAPAAPAAGEAQKAYPFPPAFYCLSPPQMRQLGYPAPCIAAASMAGAVRSGAPRPPLPPLPQGWASTAQRPAPSDAEGEQTAGYLGPPAALAACCCCKCSLLTASARPSCCHRHPCHAAADELPPELAVAALDVECVLVSVAQRRRVAGSAAGDGATPAPASNAGHAQASSAHPSAPANNNSNRTPRHLRPTNLPTD